MVMICGTEIYLSPIFSSTFLCIYLTCVVYYIRFIM